MQRDQTNLGERDRVQAVLAGDLEADIVAALGVPDSLGTSLDLSVNLVVVAGSENAEVIGGSDGGAVSGGDVTDGGAVTGDSGPLNIITSRGTGEETLVANDGVDVGGRSLQEIEESTAVEGRLLECEVELGTLVVGGGQKLEDTLGLEALGDGVSQLDLGVEGIGRVPGLGQGEAWASVDG